jgi:hypothetical protein
MHIGPTMLGNRGSIVPVVRTAHDPRPVLSNVTVFGLLGVALIHLLDLPGTIGPSPVQGTFYLVLMGACLVAAVLFLHATSWIRWLLVAAIGMAPLVTYILTRTVGLPFDRADIGNWGDRLGVAALFVESVLVLTAVYALWLERSWWTDRRRASIGGSGDRAPVDLTEAS